MSHSNAKEGSSATTDEVQVDVPSTIHDHPAPLPAADASTQARRSSKGDRQAPHPDRDHDHDVILPSVSATSTSVLSASASLTAASSSLPSRSVSSDIPEPAHPLGPGSYALHVGSEPGSAPASPAATPTTAMLLPAHLSLKAPTAPTAPRRIGISSGVIARQSMSSSTLLVTPPLPPYRDCLFEMRRAGCSGLAWAYAAKFGGVPGQHRPPASQPRDWLFVALACLASIATLAAITYQAGIYSQGGLTLVVGSFGASTILINSSPTATMSQPANVIAGHLLSAFVGVALRKAVVDAACHDDAGCIWFTAGLSVACAIAAMMALGIPHPPGGGTALIAVTGDEAIVSLGWMYILMPAGVGAIILVVIGMLLNNLHPHRQYPIYWY